MKQTQRAKILAYCKAHGSITARDAYVELDINSPRKRISELRRSGFNVDTVTEYRTNSLGIETRYNRYFITDEVKQ
jgi:predicted ArsR family transcriptional regulator